MIVVGRRREAGAGAHGRYSQHSEKIWFDYIRARPSFPPAIFITPNNLDILAHSHPREFWFLVPLQIPSGALSPSDPASNTTHHQTNTNRNHGFRS
jgi:hypothetical protein